MATTLLGPSSARTHRVTWEVDGALCCTEGSEKAVTEIRDFMLCTSPLKRDNISEVMEIKHDV